MFKSRIGITGAVKWAVMAHLPEALRELALLKRLHTEGKISRAEWHKQRRVILGDRTYSPIKQRERSLFQKLLLTSPLMAGINHNIVTNEGDALIADLLQVTPERTKLDATATIGVGTGYVSETKTVDALVTQTGADETVDSGYPQTKGAWAAADDNVIVYVATFEAGDLNDTGIDEAILESTTPDCMAYAQITPTVDVTTADTLEITWELTILGA